MCRDGWSGSHVLISRLWTDYKWLTSWRLPKSCCQLLSRQTVGQSESLLRFWFCIIFSNFTMEMVQFKSFARQLLTMICLRKGAGGDRDTRRIIIIMVISVAPYLRDSHRLGWAQRTLQAQQKCNPSPPPPPPPPPHTHAHTHGRPEGMQRGWGEGGRQIC